MKIKNLIIFIFLFLMSLSACAADINNNILIIGDSLSAGHGIDIQKSWPVLLQQKLEAKQLSYQIINASISGSTTSNGLAVLSSDLEKYKPRITIIELGGNDGLRGIDIDTIKNNLQQMISLSQQAQSKVLLLGVRLPPNYGIVYNQKFSAVFTDLAKKNNIALVPLFLSGIDDHSALMQIDGIHPKADAQPMMLDNIWPALEKLL